MAGAALVAAIIVAPQAARNDGLYGNVLGAAAGPELSGYVNEVVSPRVWVSNFMRNVAAQLATPSSQVNQAIAEGVRQAHAILAIGVDSPLSTWRGSHFRMVFTLHEDSASNPLQLIFVAAAIVAVLLDKQSRARAYSAWVVGGFGLVCIVLKWQPWNSRLELPLFILAMPLLGVAASAYLPRRGSEAVALVLGLVALPYLIGNSTRPLVGPRSVLLTDRLNQYFYYPPVPDESASYLAAARALSAAKCGRIGLVIAYDDREYLSWATLGAYQPDIELEHILVKNPSGQYGAGFAPCAILSTSMPGKQLISYEDRQYVRVSGTDPLSLFLETNAPP
jgi:hypothetical protein